MTAVAREDALVPFYEGKYAGRARRDRYPLYCLFELTPTCNLRCQFCYVALDPYKGPYLSTEQVFSIIDKLEEAGVLYLTLTGGEILSRRDFREIYLYARQKGFFVILFTNATMMSERTAELLREHPPFLVEVSIYGADAEHYERTTQIPGSFARFVRGLDLLQASGVKLVLKTPLSSFVEDHIEALVEFAKVRGLPYKMDTSIDPRHDGGGEPTLYRIESRHMPGVHEQVAASNRKFFPELQAEDEHRPRYTGQPLPECSDVDPTSTAEELYRCGAGRTGLFIDGLGNASHCVIDREPMFPLLTMSFEEVWRRMGEWVTQPLPSDAPCSGCSLRHECNNCPARARLATGSPYLKDTYQCDMTHHVHGLAPVDHPDYREIARRQLGSCVT